MKVMAKTNRLRDGRAFGDYLAQSDVKRRVFFTNSGRPGVNGRPYTVLGEPYTMIRSGVGVQVVDVTFIDVPGENDVIGEKYPRKVELCLSERSVSAEELPNIRFKGKVAARRLVEELNLR